MLELRNEVVERWSWGVKEWCAGAVGLGNEGVVNWSSRAGE